jgi:uncharacterized protein involved in outer membrane biogenesis
MTTESDNPTRESFSNFFHNLLNYRTIRFWILMAVVLYTLSGFFLAPWLVREQIIRFSDERLSRSAHVENVRVNPYQLSLEITGFGLDDRDGETLAAFDRLFVNFQLSSLFRWALTFREISVERPYLFFERLSEENNRWSMLMSDLEASADPDDRSEEQESGLPRLLIHDIAIEAGRGVFQDQVPDDPVRIEAGPVSVEVFELNTLPDRFGEQSVSVTLPDGASLGWRGNISLQPFHSEGSLELANIRLDPLAAYLKMSTTIEELSAVLSARTTYRLAVTGDGDSELTLGEIESTLENVSVTGLLPSTEFFTLRSASLSGGSLAWPQQQVHFAALRLDQPSATAWLDETGVPGFATLTREAEPASPPDPAVDADSRPWRVSLDTFAIEGGAVDFTDLSIQPNAELGLRDVTLKVSNIDNEADTRMPAEFSARLQAGGQLGFRGAFVALPEPSLIGTATTDELPLTIAQPYAAQMARIRIVQGLLGSQVDLTIAPEREITAAGTASIRQLEIDDTGAEESLLAWDALEIDRFETDALGRTFRLSLLDFEAPYGRMRINEDLSTNVGNLFPEQGGKAGETPDEPPEPWALVIGGIKVDSGSLDFADLSLPLPFSTRVTGLEGTISTIDNRSSESANIRLEGQVDEYGLARIEGGMTVLDPLVDTDVSVEFRNLLMSSFSPYTVQFAGYKIAGGKLDLDLNYVIQQGQLAGQNDIVLSDVELGEKVDSPDAASLPLGLAIALLKDSEGVIDVDLPVEGDVNDPEFKIGGVVWKAIAGLITKVVSAPFRLLGNLIGIESEDLGTFQFLAGRTDLTPPELEKIGQLRQALEQRPELIVEISGVYDTDIDTPVLQYFELRNELLARLGEAPADDTLENELLDVKVRGVLETLYREQFPDADPEALKAAHTAPPADDPEGKPVLDDLAYATDLRDRLLAEITISAADLEALANQRARVIADAFLAESGFGADRVRLTEAQEVESEDGEWLVLELGVAAD